MEILPKTKIADVIKEYPQLEEKIITLAPQFKNLKNPVLRKTVGKLATLEKAAVIGKLDVQEFVNTLRSAIGQTEIDVKKNIQAPLPTDRPDWTNGDPKHEVNGTEMLAKGVHPLAKINELMLQITAGEYLVLLTDFAPIPLIDAMKQQNYKTHSMEKGTEYFTFIGK